MSKKKALGKDKVSKAKKKLPTRKIYMGTIRAQSDGTQVPTLGVEPNSGLSPEFGPRKMPIKHHACGNLTLIEFDLSQEGKEITFTCSGCLQVVTSIPTVERASSNQFHFFGDESVAGQSVLYGILVINADYHESATLEIQRILDEDSGTTGTRFHCKEVFHDSTREKTVWASKNSLELWTTCLKVATCLKEHNAMFVFGAAHLESFPEVVPGLTDKKVTAEHLYPVAFWGAMVGLQAHGLISGNGPRPTLTIDKQQNRITFWGLGKRKVQRLLRHTDVDVTIAPSDSKSILLDATDIILYAIGRNIRGVGPLLARQIVELIDPVRRDGYWQPDDPERPEHLSISWDNGVPMRPVSREEAKSKGFSE